MNSSALPPGKFAQSPARILRIGKWTVDSELDEISAGGDTIKLEPRAMRLLLHLAARPRQVVGIQELLDVVWPNVIVTSQSVYATIAELRRSLGDSAESAQYIATVARKGYRLVAPVVQLPPPAALPPDNAEPPRQFPAASESTDSAVPAKRFGDRATPPARRGRWFALAGLSLVLILSAIFAIRAVERRQPAPVAARSIAVLPFVDMSQAKDQEYLADGLAEQIVERLSQVPQLQVAARTSAFSFKGSAADIPTIAGKLLVANVLEGSVQKAGDRLRVTAQLVRGDSGYHLWSATYDRQIDDVFEIQDEIATAVAKALKASLAPSATPILGTKNAAANDLYLQASFYYGRVSVEGMAKTAQLLDKALSLDPKYAAAWALLSRVKMAQYRHKLIPSDELQAAYQAAHTAADTAVVEDPNLPEAHTALGRVLLMAYATDHDPVKIKLAAEQFQRAIALDPRNADAIVQLGSVASTEGRYSESIRLDRMALEADPLNVNIMEVLGGVYMGVGDYAAADQLFRRELDISPHDMYAVASRTRALALLGRPAEALRVIDTDSQMSDQAQKWWRAMLYPALGRKLEGDTFYNALQKNSEGIDALEMAELDAYRGNANHAFVWLQRAYSSDAATLRVYLGVDPWLRNLRDDPRFDELEQRLKN